MSDLAPIGFRSREWRGWGSGFCFADYSSVGEVVLAGEADALVRCALFAMVVIIRARCCWCAEFGYRVGSA
jgi:hypothetical protein